MKAEIDLALAPASAGNALAVYWTRTALEEGDRAAEALHRCAAHGVVLPFEP
ncbi:MAG TPA: hypothetical protein VML55_17105 [Planctomycetaceae bacterium]|nr:hypothetical protein [Planctomycetaceae bacterium]